jgi:hypothetical protein
MSTRKPNEDSQRQEVDFNSLYEAWYVTYNPVTLIASEYKHLKNTSLQPGGLLRISTPSITPFAKELLSISKP